MKSEKLEVKNLVFNYGVNNILNDISFNVDKGEFVAVVERVVLVNQLYCVA